MRSVLTKTKGTKLHQRARVGKVEAVFLTLSRLLRTNLLEVPKMTRLGLKAVRNRRKRVRNNLRK